MCSTISCFPLSDDPFWTTPLGGRPRYVDGLAESLVGRKHATLIPSISFGEKCSTSQDAVHHLVKHFLSGGASATNIWDIQSSSKSQDDMSKYLIGYEIERACDGPLLRSPHSKQAVPIVGMCLHMYNTDDVNNHNQLML